MTAESKAAYHSNLKIDSTFPLNEGVSHYFIHVAQEIVERLLPEWLLIELNFNASSQKTESQLFEFSRILPLIRSSPMREDSKTVSFDFIFPAQYTHGAGRYIADILSRWLFPGRQMALVGGFGLNFCFAGYPSPTFYVRQEIISIRDPEEFQMIKKNMGTLLEEIKLNIRAVYHARYLTSLRSSNQGHKNLIINENISSILNKNEEINRNLYDQMHSILVKTNTEEKMSEIKKNISDLLKKRPKTFDRDIFYEIALFSTFFKDSFSSKRSSTHLSRVIAYQYLFKKIIAHKTKLNATERHLSIKIIRTSIAREDVKNRQYESGSSFDDNERFDKKSLTEKFDSSIMSGTSTRSNDFDFVLAILVGFNFIKETERFDSKHFLEAIKSLLPSAKIIPDSFIADRRDDKIRFFYIELNNSLSTHHEVRVLKEKLPQEITRQIQNVVHPVFMPRNDEELMRNLIVLNKQIKYVRDLPQVSIHYDMQSESELTFTVVLVRLVRNPGYSLSRLLHEVPSVLKFDIDDIRIAGYLKNKYPKEASILRTTLNKSPFFRPDHSVDLLRARQKIVGELTKILGEFRDFNGGIILKQDESLCQLRECIGKIDEDKELLLENYFYSLRPGIMQTVYDSSTLKVHFELLLKAICTPFLSQTHHIFSQHDGKYFLCFIKAITPSFKEVLLDGIASLQIPSYDLTTTFLQVDQSALLGLILRFDAMESIETFKQKISSSMSSWAAQVACSITLIDKKKRV